MHHTPVPRFQAYRLFTFRLDGEPRSKVIDHSPGLAPSVQTLQLQRRFFAWLESEAPGCAASGRMTDLVIVDDVRRVDGGVPH